MSPVSVPAIGAYIREQREQARISLRQLAQAAGVSNPYLSQIERGLRKPSADILQQIAKGLRISAEALYVQAGFLEDRPSGQGVRDAVLTDAALTERQKQMLLEIYDSFRTETALAAEGLARPDEPEESAGPREAGIDPAALAWPEEPDGLAEAYDEAAASVTTAPDATTPAASAAPASTSRAAGRAKVPRSPRRAASKQALDGSAQVGSDGQAGASGLPGAGPQASDGAQASDGGQPSSSGRASGRSRTSGRGRSPDAQTSAVKTTGPAEAAGGRQAANGTGTAAEADAESLPGPTAEPHPGPARTR